MKTLIAVSAATVLSVAGAQLQVTPATSTSVLGQRGPLTRSPFCRAFACRKAGKLNMRTFDPSQAYTTSLPRVNVQVNYDINSGLAKDVIFYGEDSRVGQLFEAFLTAETGVTQTNVTLDCLKSEADFNARALGTNGGVTSVKTAKGKNLFVGCSKYRGYDQFSVSNHSY